MHHLMRPFVIALLASLASACVAQEAEKETDKDLAADLELLQGSWELIHGNQGTQSIKIIDGNKETLRRFNAKTGELLHEHSVHFKLSKSGSVRVYTFYFDGADPDKHGKSYVYKVDKENFYDIPGLLHGDEYRNYQLEPKIWHWKRLRDADGDVPENKDAKE